MASTNPNRPRGLVPQRYMNSSPWNGQANLYVHTAAAAVDAYIYDLTTFDGTNRSNGAAAGFSDKYVNGLPAVINVASDVTTAVQRGVIAGFVPEPDFNMSVTASLGLKYRKASTLRYTWVIDDPFVIFEVQEDGQSYTSGTANAINKTCGTVYTAGSTVTGVSKVQLKSSDVQTAAVRPMRILRYAKEVDNFNWVASDTVTYAKFEVVMSNSDLWGMAPSLNFGA